MTIIECFEVGRLARSVGGGGGLMNCETQWIFQHAKCDEPAGKATLATTQGQIDGLLSQLPFKCYLPEETSEGD